MKNYLLALTIAMLTLPILSTSCDKEEEIKEEEKVVIDTTSKTPPPPANSDYLKATVKGINLTASSPVCEFVSGIYTIYDGKRKTDPNVKTVMLGIGEWDSITYYLEGDYQEPMESYTHMHLISKPSIIHITKHDRTAKFIEGTFDYYAVGFFNDEDTIHVTNGSFGVHY